MRACLFIFLVILLCGCSAKRYAFQTYDEGILSTYVGSIHLSGGAVLTYPMGPDMEEPIDLVTGTYDCMAYYTRGSYQHMEGFRQWIVINQASQVNGLRWEPFANEVYDTSGLVFLWGKAMNAFIIDRLYNEQDEVYDAAVTYLPCEQGGVWVKGYQLNARNSTMAILPSSGSQQDELYLGYEGDRCVAIKMVRAASDDP